MKVLFLQTAHTTQDDRVWYHQRAALLSVGVAVDVCGVEALQEARIKEWNDNADTYDSIVVDTPRALWKVRKAKQARLLYDITEWYPSKKNLHGSRGLHKWSKACLMAIASLWAGIRTDAFIFGETDKARPFRWLFPHKQYINLPYYPDLQYIPTTTPHDIQQKCHILYAGPLTEEKGYKRVLEVVQQTQQLCPNTHLQLDIITGSPIEARQKADIEVHYLPYLPFEDFCKSLCYYDLFLDLRDRDRENIHCLPIKLFYYMACGRPSIYSKLKAIRKGIPECDSCTTLVNSIEEAADAIVHYIQDERLYQSHCENALKLSQEKYNWDSIKNDFIQFIDQLGK